jgi:hypothetical protein
MIFRRTAAIAAAVAALGGSASGDVVFAGPNINTLQQAIDTGYIRFDTNALHLGLWHSAFVVLTAPPLPPAPAPPVGGAAPLALSTVFVASSSEFALRPLAVSRADHARLLAFPNDPILALYPRLKSARTVVAGSFAAQADAQTQRQLTEALQAVERLPSDKRQAARQFLGSAVVGNARLAPDQVQPLAGAYRDFKEAQTFAMIGQPHVQRRLEVGVPFEATRGSGAVTGLAKTPSTSWNRIQKDGKWYAKTWVDDSLFVVPLSGDAPTDSCLAPQVRVQLSTAAEKGQRLTSKKIPLPPADQGNPHPKNPPILKGKTPP